MTSFLADPKIHHWEQRFATDDYVFGQQPNAFLLSQAHRLAPGQRALAVADGEGRNGVWLATQGLDVTSIDAAANALKKAHRLAKQHQVPIRLEQANLLNWTWPIARYDVVVAIFIQFLTPTERPQVFNAMKRALKPGGLLILQGYTPRQLEFKTGGPSVPGPLYTAETIRELLADMRILHLDEHNEVLAEGTGHKGMSAVIDVVAKLTDQKQPRVPTTNHDGIAGLRRKNRIEIRAAERGSGRRARHSRRCRRSGWLF